jgi:hypothetical protein
MAKDKAPMFVLRIVAIVSFLLSCNTAPEFDIEFYQKTTSIQFPKDYKVVATTDNGEFLTITILDIEKNTLKAFTDQNNFIPVNDESETDLMGLQFLDSNYHLLPDTKLMLIKQVEKLQGKIGWTYLADTTTGRLYCEIDYPDFGGN